MTDRYGNTEREMSAIVHRFQPYHTYRYASTFIMITDSKPPVSICAKPVHNACC